MDQFLVLELLFNSNTYSQYFLESRQFEPKNIGLNVPNYKHVQKEFFDKKSRQLNNTFSNLSERTSLIPKNWKSQPSVICDDQGNRFLSVQTENDQNYFFNLSTFDKTDLDSTQQINLVSGCCLFGQDSACVTLADGQVVSLAPLKNSRNHVFENRILNLEIEDQMSLYEHETIKRLGNVISSYEKNQTIPTKIFLNIPKVEYYFVLFSAWANDLVSQDVLAGWFREVNKRSKFIKDNFTQHLIKSGVKSQIESSSLLDVLEDYLFECVQNSQYPDFQTCVNLLKSKHPIFEKFSDHLELKNWFDLSNVSYSLFYLEKIANNGNEVLVAIENHHERRILKEASQLVKLEYGEKSNVMVGLYPLNKVFFKHLDKTHNLNLFPNHPNLTNSQTLQNIDELYLEPRHLQHKMLYFL